ncbi:MAG: helix-turn-helix domain-containing protein [Thermodesulfobacteriota bacterium]
MPRPARGGARERMIVAAERLFAERGIGEVSLREIGAAAGQRNNGAAQYHFGTKAGLVRAIVEYRMRPLNQRRLQLLAELDAASRGGDLRALVVALVQPLAESLAGARTHWARFLAQAFAEPGAAFLGELERPEMAGLREVVTRLDAALAALPAALREDRLGLAGTLLIHAVAQWERRLAGRGRRSVELPVLAADLVDALVAVLAAPVSPATKALLTR